MFSREMVPSGNLSGEEYVFTSRQEASPITDEPVDFKTLRIDPDVIKRIPARFAVFFKIIPIDYKDDVLTIAAAYSLNIDIVDGAGLVVVEKVHIVPAKEKDILDAIRQYYGVGAETIDQMRKNFQPEESITDNAADIPGINSEASIGKFVRQIIFAAYKDRASDIHIEPFEHELKIRYRIDGVLYDAPVPSNIRGFKDAINSRIKVMANLNIAEKRLPQDGRFKFENADIKLDLRVSFLPTQYGESVVIRILSSTRVYNMAELGLEGKALQNLNNLIKKPHGIIFVAGPTGSGKTTTLYSCLSSLNKVDKKIITIEDPIEYQLKGITQVQVNPGIDLTFAAGLRSMLRHDPDIMMVGEVRDRETAEIAVQIALTGHLVFSTLHTNDAVSGITRLIDMGVEPYLVASSVECFVAQRLVRLICPECKVPVKITSQIIRDFEVSVSEFKNQMIYKERGCERCNFTGYFGREGIYEILFINDEIREMILARVSSAQIKNRAVDLGMTTLLQHGWEKVKQGLTTPGEIIRVTREDEK